ncbi:fimbrial usher protein [Hyphomonas neptunium ATCC 15444]|uniref:Fimbrial usher protein n=2 Tax=Hyphomonas TaxID=85 RepID=Q0BZA4_HYPNA|nr:MULTISPECIES: fimbria/pilus outer membrane usher protein [Hyphomonas]ABI76841.1 fimbrial usher protein [Hyphomonas neptunium ATCC 15444]KCZ95278.1 fimbrial usher protein [Hyphomonas hirschiana VP5]
MNWQRALLLTSATWFGGGKALAEPFPEAPQSLELTFPVSVNGQLAGNVLADVGLRTDPNVDAEQLLGLLSKTFDQNVLSRIASNLPDERRVGLDRLRTAGLDIRYNSQALRLEITATEQETRQQILSLTGVQRPDPANYLAPSRAAAGITASLLAEYRHETDVGDAGFQPVEAAAQGFVNVGGFEGFTLDFDVRVTEDAELIRNGVVLSKDDYERGIRYSAGDIDPPVTGFQSTPTLGGLSVSRQFGTIQPFRDIRPSGQQGLYLQRAATVDVVVNGVIIRTLNLAAGRYELRDFPFIDAAADVEFYVDDGAGRQQVASLSLFGSDGLIEPGVSVFSGTLGLQSETRTPNENYDGDLAFTGYYERGLTRGLTLGANIQASARESTIGLRAATASGLGRISVDMAGSTREGGQGQETGYAFAATYRNFFNVTEELGASLELAASSYSPHFSTLGDGLDIQPREWDAAARASVQLPAAASVTVGARLSRGRGTVPDEEQYDVSVSKLFGRVNTFVSVGYDAVTQNATGRIGVSLRWGQRSAVRSSYNSRNDLFVVEAERMPRLQVKDLSGRFGYERRPEADVIYGDGLYRGNRVEIAARHIMAAPDVSRSPSEQITTARVSTGIGITPEGWALGRRTDEGFAIVRPHKSLRGQDIDLGAGYARGAVAKVDGLGAVAVPLIQPYVPQSVRVDVRNLPAGYDIGSARYDVMPGSGSGYNIVIGSDASYTIVGTLVSETRDLYLSTGTLTSQESGEAYAFFTNRTGRFVLERIAPGDYELRLDGDDFAVNLKITESEESYVDLGNIILP